MKQKEIQLLNINMSATGIFILTIIISTLLTYNDKLKLQNKKPFLKKKSAEKILIINRLTLLIIAFIYLYTSYEDYKLNKIKKKKNKTTNSFINLIINEIQLITVIVIVLMPFIFKDEDEAGDDTIITP